MLRFFFNTPKNRSLSPPEALLVNFLIKTLNFGPQNGPQKLRDSGGGGLRRALEGPLGAQVGQDGPKSPPRAPKTPKITPKGSQKPALKHVF